MWSSQPSAARNWSRCRRVRATWGSSSRVQGGRSRSKPRSAPPTPCWSSRSRPRCRWFDPSSPGHRTARVSKRTLVLRPWRHELRGECRAIAEEVLLHLLEEEFLRFRVAEVQPVLVHEHLHVLEPQLPRLFRDVLVDALSERVPFEGNSSSPVIWRWNLTQKTFRAPGLSASIGGRFHNPCSQHTAAPRAVRPRARVAEEAGQGIRADQGVRPTSRRRRAWPPGAGPRQVFGSLRAFARPSPDRARRPSGIDASAAGGWRVSGTVRDRRLLRLPTDGSYCAGAHRSQFRASSAGIGRSIARYRPRLPPRSSYRLARCVFTGRASRRAAVPDLVQSEGTGG